MPHPLKVFHSASPKWIAGCLAIVVSLMAVDAGLAATAGAKTSARKTPFKVFVSGTYSGFYSVFQKGSQQGVQAGLAGSGAKVTWCDNLSTPSGEAACEQKAVNAHADVFLASSALTGLSQSLLNRAHIPVVGHSGLMTSNSFGLNGINGYFIGAAAALWNRGCRTVGIFAPEGETLHATYVAKAQKWRKTTTVYLPNAATDFSAQVAKVASARPQCLAVLTLPTQYAQIILGLNQSGIHVPTVVAAYGVTPPVVKALGSLVNGLIVVATYSPAKEAREATAAIHKIDSGLDVQQPALVSYAWATAIKVAASKVKGKATPAKMLAALNSLRNLKTGGVYPPISMIPRKGKTIRRDFAPFAKTWVYQDGKLTKPSGWLDLRKQYDAAGS